MRRKVLIAAFCWLTLSETSAKAVQTAYGVGLIDNISDESAPRLYRNVPVGVYASATPYAAYSFHTPTLVAPKNGPVIPVKEESLMVQNSNGYLKDSYGQRFVEAPQTIAYKAVFPQQFVQLQNLPAHLSQPLVASSNLQYGQGTPHFFQQPQFRTPLQTLAPSTLHQFTAAQPFVYANDIRNFAPSTSQIPEHPNTQEQSTSNKNVYVNNLTAEHFSKLQNEPKFQRIQEGPKISIEASNNNNKPNAQLKHLQLVQVPKETSITTVANGKRTILNLVSKPPVPLLDLTLLEPLTFKNPLVPQVQHFLPRINQVTYKKLNQFTNPKPPEINEVKKHQMEFIVQNTKSYDSGPINTKLTNGLGKTKQQTPQNEEKDKEDHLTPSLSVQETPHDSPEFSYETNSPNFKETVSEKELSYNRETESEPVNISYEKQTQQEPVHYTYEERTEKKPIRYSFSHSSKTPAKFRKVYSAINDDQPKQLIYHFNSEEKSKRQPNQRDSAPDQSDTERSPEENSEEINREEAPQKDEQDQQKYYNEGPKKNYHQSEPRERQQIYHHNKNEESRDISNHPRQIPYKPRHNENNFQPVVPEYEEDITIIPSHKPQAPIKFEYQHKNNKHKHNSEPQHEKRYYDYPKSHYTLSYDDRDKLERIVVKEGTTGESRKPNENLLDQMVKKQEESEEDFEKAYKDAAYGFPAYDTPFVDVEKEIYNPESYGSSRYHNNYNIEKSPLKQYEADGDDYPKYTRSQYKDARDKTMDEYFLDYAVSRPESLLERHKKKEDYYNAYTQHKPEKYFGNENNKNHKAKHTASFLNEYYAKPQQKQQSSKYMIAPKFEKYNYNDASRDNSAYSTQPQQHYKTKTQFVEPQYQYGFEPLSLPRLLDSELAAMASNHSPESEKPGIRKKGIKATWHIKKSNSKAGS